MLGWTKNVTNLIEALAASRIAPKCPPGFIPNDLPDSIAEIRARLVSASARLASLPERTPARPDRELTVAHAVYGPLSYRGWFARCAAHDLEHTGQVTALRRDIFAEA